MPHSAALERFIGIPYCARTFDCADLVVQVQRELFGRTVRLPSARPRGKTGAAHLHRQSQPLATRTTAPVDGDLVLMRDSGHKRPGHAGVYFFLAHEAWVLHVAATTGGSVLHRVRDLPDFGLTVEGFYTWN